MERKLVRFKDVPVNGSFWWAGIKWKRLRKDVGCRTARDSDDKTRTFRGEDWVKVDVDDNKS